MYIIDSDRPTIVYIVCVHSFVDLFQYGDYVLFLLC